MSKKLIIVFCLFTALFIQCTTPRSRQLNASNLAPEFFSVDITRDTVLHTKKGAIIEIPKGALSSASTFIKLELKEAYTIADMVLAGLTTKAGKAQLYSGGMLFLSPAEGNEAKIEKQITISIPTQKQVEGMKLYKGEVNSDSTINWTNPQPLPVQALNPRIARGKVLYNENCASCHNTLGDGTGPSLAFLDKRRDKKWLYRFTRNSAELIADGDALANCVYNHYNRSQMIAFPTLTDDELAAIFSYADELAADIDPNTIPDFKKSFDSCKAYLEAAGNLPNERKELVAANGKLVDVKLNAPVNNAGITLDTTSVIGHNFAGVEGENYVVPTSANSEYYKVTIEAFGWYNIDIVTKGLPGFESSELIASLKGDYKNDVTIYLILPYKKILIDGGLIAGKTDEYGFYADDGTLPLPQNEKAYIIAITEEKGLLYFGKTEFTTTRKMNTEITLTTTTPEQMRATIEKLGIAELNVAVGKSANADSIKNTDEKLAAIEKLKPKNCDCDCQVYRESDTDSLDGVINRRIK